MASLSKPATDIIIEEQQNAKDTLPFANTQDIGNAEEGFWINDDSNVYRKKNGDVVWDNDAYKFLNEDPPNEANPSLWRQSGLNAKAGLFKVHESIYQVRGFDLSNVTFVETDEGVIIIDPLTSSETAEAAHELYKKWLRQQFREGKNRLTQPVKAIIYTHSHVDHFGGVKGFVSQAEVDSREGFLEHAVSENVYTGTCMSRPGLGQTTSTGTVTLIAPTDIITQTGEEINIDGVRIVFQMAPDIEAPSEMLFYFPDFKALCAAEDATHTFHNLLTLRGAVVRDPHQWARYLTETIDLFGSTVEVIFASHHWPTWGNQQVVEFLTLQRDLYSYVHDQTLRLINKGFNGPEIAEQMVLPEALEGAWSARGYYGSVSHNVKAIYQRYVGWFDGNPSHLWEHIPAGEAFDAGDFRWAAEILNHALRGANFGTPTVTASADVVAQLTPEMLFDSLAIQINGPEVWSKQLTIDVVLTDRAEPTDPFSVPNRYRLWLSNGALIFTGAPQSTAAQATIMATTRTLPAIAVIGLHPEALEAVGVTVDDPSNVLQTLADLLDKGDPSFNIVVP
ncbi:beta-lactamase-like protein [Xylariales sp. PMI_506]|nr:beta-lactamase-like protein [Xylariales sp. PMI_506]